MTEHHADEALALLRDELAGVSAPPDFAARVQRRISEGADLLHDELAAVAVSPEFKVRVRQQVDAAPQARVSSWLGGWRWLVPVAAGIAIAVAMAWTWRGAQNTPAPITTTVSNPAQDVPTPAPRPTPRRTEAPVVASPLRHERTGVRRSTGEPSLEVITNQPAILRALYARIAAGAEIVETNTAPEPDPGIAIPEIVIDPIVVKPLPEPPGVSGTLPIIRKSPAESVERSDK
jgi:hypothetical protein